MYDMVEKLRIDLNTLVEDCRQLGVPPFIISGVLAEELSKCRSYELAEYYIKQREGNNGNDNKEN